MTKRWGIGCLSLALQAAWAVPVIHYQGMVSVGGAPFTGTGYFKFQILDRTDLPVWSQDGSPPGGPPAGYLAVPVNGGIFHVPLGDAGLGMAPVPAAALHAPPIRLRTWFSTNTVNFEQLSPDVTLQVPNLSFFDTGNLLVVDDDPGGDFSTLDDAFGHIATNANANALMIMPGYYTVAGPLVMPPDRWTVVVGMDAGALTIVNTNGPALVLGPGILRGVTVRGNPAATDAGVPTNVNVQISDSQFERFSGGGPAVALATSGTLARCHNTMFTAAEGDAVSVTGGAVLQADNSVFNAWNGAGAGLRIGDGGACEVAGARFWTSTGRAVVASGVLGYAVDFRQSDLHGGISLSNCAGRVNLHQCRADSDTNRGAAVEVIGGGAANRGVALNDGSIECNGVPAVFVQTSAGQRTRVEVRGCRINAFDLPDNAAGIVVINSDPNNESARLELFATELEVGGSGGAGVWAVRASSARVECHGGKIGAYQAGGLLAESGAQIRLQSTSLQGTVAGVRVASGSSVDIAHSTISGEEGSAVEGIGGVEVMMQHAVFEGQGSAGVGARGVASDGQRPTFFMVGCGVFGDDRALDFEDGTLLAANSTFATETGLVARIARMTAAPQVQMEHCQMIRLGASALPAARLAGNPAPTPAFAHCAFHAEGAAAAIGLDGAAGATISLVNSTLNTNLAAGILVKPATSLGNGNYVP